MNTTLYYFSGTGNSLAAARKIASILGDTVLIPIASLNSGSGPVSAPEGRVGIICPVYDMGVPVLVNEFLTRLQVSDGSYLFAVLTLGGTGASALNMINAGLVKHAGRKLDAGFLVKMPGNFPPLSPPPTGKKCDDILAGAEKDLEVIAAKIRAETSHPPGLALFSSIIQKALYGGFSRGVRASGEKFTVSDSCTSCGICSSVCPTANITLSGGKPVWNHHCELCCGCLNFCPTQAIDLHIMFGTKGRGRYHHPSVTVADMQNQKGHQE